MLRLSVDTKLTPHAVLEKAGQYFGQRGLTPDADQLTTESAVYTGGGGYVSISAIRVAEDLTEAIVETREWEYDARHFAETLA